MYNEILVLTRFTPYDIEEDVMFSIFFPIFVAVVMDMFCECRNKDDTKNAQKVSFGPQFNIEEIDEICT